MEEGTFNRSFAPLHCRRGHELCPCVGRCARSALRRLGSSSPKISSINNNGTAPVSSDSTRACAIFKASASVRCWPSNPYCCAEISSTEISRSSRCGPTTVCRRRISFSPERARSFAKSPPRVRGLQQSIARAQGAFVGAQGWPITRIDLCA